MDRLGEQPFFEIAAMCLQDLRPDLLRPVPERCISLWHVHGGSGSGNRHRSPGFPAVLALADGAKIISGVKIRFEVFSVWFHLPLDVLFRARAVQVDYITTAGEVVLDEGWAVA